MSEIKKVTQEMRLKLRAPLPADAVKQNPSKTFLSTIKPIYVTERLNEVFGIGAWQVRTELVNPVAIEAKKSAKRDYNEYTALMKTTLTIPEYGIYYECVAGSSNEDEGDSTKGGTTDGITKIASWMEIGISVFQGNGNKALEPTIEEGLTAILASTSYKDIDAAWKRYPHLRAVEAFKSAAKAMTALYPKEEPKQPEKPANETKESPVKFATQKQVDLIRNLINSHHIPEDYRQSVVDIESNYEGKFPLSDFERVYEEIQEYIKKGTDYEKTTAATEDQVKEIGTLLYNELFTDAERKAGFAKLQKGFSITQARTKIDQYTSIIQERKDKLENNG